MNSFNKYESNIYKFLGTMLESGNNKKCKI
jgi:hypothetical protein